MTYDPTKDDFAYDFDLSEQENRVNCRARWQYLEDWARDNWDTSCHAAGCAARAEYLYERANSDLEFLQETYEPDGWVLAESLLEDYGMVEILDKWVERGEPTCDWGSYDWMLWATGYDIPNTVEYVNDWLEKNDYHQAEKINQLFISAGWVTVD